MTPFCSRLEMFFGFFLKNKKSSGTVISFFDQMNRIVLDIIKFICSLIPAFIFVSFLGLLISASTMAGLESNRKVCIEKYGISQEKLEFSLMVQQVFYKICLVISFFCCYYSVCHMFGNSYSLSGYIIMAITVFIMAIVAPPVPGGAIFILTFLFVMESIPESGIQLFVSIYFIVDMITSGAHTFCISDEMVAIDRKLNNNL